MSPGEGKVLRIAAVVAVGFVAACAWHYVQGSVLGHRFPHDTFLFSPGDRFNDFLHEYWISEDLNPYFTDYRFKSVYFPFTNLVVWLFTLLPPKPSYLLLVTLFAASLIGLFLWAMAALGIPAGRRAAYAAVLAVLTYPVLFLVDRGNTDLYVFILLAGFLVAYARGRTWVAAVLLGAAAAMKLFPAVYGLLFLADRRYREGFIAAGTFVGLTVLSLLCFKGGFGANLAYVLSGFGSPIQANAMYLWDNNFLQRSCSLFTLSKWALILTGAAEGLDSAATMKVYTLLVFALFGVAAWWTVFRERAPWRRVLLLTAVLILFPHVSADYRMVYLLLPIALFLRAPAAPGDGAFAILFGLLLVPKAYHFMTEMVRSDAPGGVSESVVLNPVLLLAITVLAIRQGFRQWNAESATPATSS